MRYLILAILILAPLTALAHMQDAQIQIVDSKTHDRIQSSLLPAPFHQKLKERLQVYAIVNGEHVFLECANDKCETLATGTYDGSYRKDFVHIRYKVPLSDKWRTNYYKVLGTWN